MLKEQNITSISGTLTKDTTVTKSGKTLATVRLEEVKDEKKGITSSANGVVKVLVSSLKTEGLYREKAIFNISCIKDDFYYASTMKLIKPHSFLNRIRLSFLHDVKERLLHIEHSKNLTVSWYARRLSSLLLFQDTFDEEFPLKNKGATLGLSHIFALSGMHLNLIASFLTFLFSFVFPKRKVKFVILPFLGVYTFLVGASPSLVRAFLMKCISSFLSCSVSFSLFLSLIIQSVLFKESILTSSFEFSFISTVALVTAYQFFRFTLSSVFPNKLATSFALGVSALVFSSPLSIAIFGTWSPGGVFLSSIASLFVAINMVGGIILIVFQHSYIASLLLDGSYFLLDKCMDISLYVFNSYSLKGFCVFLSILLVLFLIKLYICRKIHKSML